MAKYERTIYADFNDVLRTCENAISSGSASASYEDGSNVSLGGVQVCVRVYERYSMLGGNRVSLNLTLVGDGNQVALSAITSGGSQAVLFKINTFGEGAFLDTLVSAIEQRYPR